MKATIDSLNFLSLAGYRVSKKKAQIVQERVQCLGYEISEGQREFGTEQKEAICRIADPKSKWELRGWIPNYGLFTKPLHAAIKGPGNYLEWTPECRKGFDEIKKELMRAPALGLLDLTKPFQLYVHERQHVSLAVLTQFIGDWKRPVAYFSKQLDEVSKVWPAACER